MSLLTPPLTPKTHSAVPAMTSAGSSGRGHGRNKSTSSLHKYRPGLSSPLATPDDEDFALPPPLEAVPDLEMPAAAMDMSPPAAAVHAWRPGMSREDKDAREEWLADARGRRGLRIVIVTENFLPKVDGVTRTLARLLEHLEREGHQCMLLGPGTGMSHYASHPLVGTAGVPLVIYPGLKLNFLRPKFLRVIQDFEPDVVHFVDPIWLGAQTLMAMELGWAGSDWVGAGGPAIGTGISGAVVASYHTNLATYATLFGMSWLEPIMWRLQRWLYSKTLLTLCPSPSTKGMLESQAFSDVRLWPRGVDLSQFGPSKRSAEMRALWGVSEAPGAPARIAEKKPASPVSAGGIHHSGRKTSLPLTPPASPVVMAASDDDNDTVHAEPECITPGLPSRVVLLYVGRISWEKNLVLLLRAYGRLSAHLPAGFTLPKLVFVGDGPARTELESICEEECYDATFMGHRSGAELAACYASADVFVFPSFTETFGQVVLEALASGLPVIGLDAEGTRDLVSHASTGLLLPLPAAGVSWPSICRNESHPLFSASVDTYAALIARASTQHAERAAMAARACTDGIRGFTWWDAMERCVDGYREAVGRARLARRQRAAEEESGCVSDSGSTSPAPSSSPGSSPRRVSHINRALSSRLTPRRARKFKTVRRSYDPAETLWHLKNVAKVLLAAVVFYYIFARHVQSKGREMGWDEVMFRPQVSRAVVSRGL